MSPAMVEVRTAAAAEAEAEARNPSDKGQIFAPLIDKSSTFINQQREENPNFIKSMDQPNPFQCPPASSSGKPALTRARFNKQRRNTSNRKPAAAAAAAVPEADKIEEKINSWNPFAAESGARVSEGTSGIGCAFGGLFGFGAPVEFGSSGANFNWNSSGRSVGSLDSVRSEGSQFVSGSKLDTGVGLEKNDDLRSEGSSPLASDEGSVFSNLPAELSKLDIKNLGNGDDFEKKKQAEIPFASGANSVNTLPENAEFAPGVGMGKQTAGSVLRSGVKKSVNWSQNSSFGSDEGSSYKLRDEMGKLNINVDEFGKKKQTEPFVFMGGMNVSGIPGSSSGGAEFISGSISGSQLINEASGKPTTHSFSLGSEQPSSKLPAEMKNLNLNSTRSVDNFEKNKQAGNNFVSGSSKTGSRLTSVITLESAGFASVAGAVSGLDKPTADSVIFGSKGSGSAGSSTFIFSSGVKESVDLSSDDGFQKTKAADNVFVGSNKDATGSFSSGFASKVPEEIGKFIVGREKVTQGMMNEGAGSAAGVFASVSSTNNSAFSRFDNGMAFNIPADKNLSTEGLDMGKEMGSKLKGDEGNVFSSFGGNAVNTVRDHMEKLEIGTNAENLAGRDPFKINLQAGIEDHISNMGSIPSTPDPVFQSPGPRFSFTANSTGLETPHMEFKTPQQDATRLTKETLFTESYQNPPFRTKKGDAKSIKPKKKRDKIRQPAPVCESFPAQFVSEESCSQVNSEADSTGGYSPMDYSPYHEDVVADQYSREPSLASENSIPFVFGGVSTDTQRSVSCDEREEVLVSEAQRLNINEGNLCQGEVGNDGSKDNDKRNSSAESAYEQTNKFGTGSDITDMLKHENMGIDNDSRTAPMQAETGFFSSNIERLAGGARIEFTFSSNLDDLGGSSFAFEASPFGQGSLPTTRHYHRRKNRLKSGQNSSVSAPNGSGPLASPLPDLIPRFSISGLPDSVEGQQNTSSIPQSHDETKTGKSKELESRQESTSSATATVTVQEACEKWRFRGNQAYANGYLTKAEDYYTRGVNSVTLKEIPSSCIRPLTLCYSNRAATRMSLGKMREALSDCMMAVSIDPNFLKARVRVANCYLALGEIGEALKHFKKCLQSEKDISPDEKYLIEASGGLQKAQQVADLTGQSAELLLRRTFDDACKSLNMISEALSISPHSESLLEMKAEALLMMQNYEEVIKLCEQTLDLAEQNSAVTTVDSQFNNKDLSEHMKSSPARLWRWRLIAKSYFCLGKLEEALVLIRKHDKLKSAVDKSSDSSTSFAITVHELLRLKSAGNEAFQAGRHSEAVECYTSALACSAESRPFTAVCFCNRAAAYQALGQITDAIADCSHAIALDPTYPKAISRRATLHEMIRDYGQAARDLNRLISLLKKQMEGKDNQSTGGGRSTAKGTDLKRALARLATVEEEARKGISLDMYMILGIEPSSSAADIKKAYRKAALRHHPDKAGQFLVRNENVDDGLWREVAAEVHADADRLFKMIGEAYTILSDPTKRLQYDDEEGIRACTVKSYNGGTPRTSSDANSSSHYEKSFNRRQWRPQGSSYQRYY